MKRLSLQPHLLGEGASVKSYYQFVSRKKDWKTLFLPEIVVIIAITKADYTYNSKKHNKIFGRVRRLKGDVNRLIYFRR